jgi:uncharacterized membrane protein
VILRRAKQSGAMRLVASFLAVYGAFAVYVAIFANDPAQGDLLAKRAGAIPWFGLSALGALAAVAWLVAYRHARVLLLVSAVCLAGWTACYWLGTDQGAELNAIALTLTAAGRLGPAGTGPPFEPGP